MVSQPGSYMIVDACHADRSLRWRDCTEPDHVLIVESLRIYVVDISTVHGYYMQYGPYIRGIEP